MRQRLVKLLFYDGPISIYNITDHNVGFTRRVESPEKMGTEEDHGDKLYNRWMKEKAKITREYEKDNLHVTDIDGVLFILHKDVLPMIIEQEYL